MIPPFKYYFYPFLNNLEKRGTCRLYDLGKYIANDLNIARSDLFERTKSKRTTKHSSRLNYCASYLKKMKLVESTSTGVYVITSRGKEVLMKFGSKLSLDELRNLPEFIATQINTNKNDYVYVKPHIRGGRKINAYIIQRDKLKKDAPYFDSNISESNSDYFKNENDQ